MTLPYSPERELRRLRRKASEMLDPKFDPTEDNTHHVEEWSKTIPGDCPFDAECPGDFVKLGQAGVGTAWRCTMCGQAFTLYPPHEMEEIA